MADDKIPFTSHLEELRKRIIICLIAVVAGFLLSYNFSETIFALLVKPLMSGICGTDKHGYKGEAVQYAGTPREVNGPYPAIPGHENVALVVEARPPRGQSAVLDFYGLPLAEGDRVVISPDIVCGKCYWCRNTYGYTWCDNIRSYGHLVSTEPPHLFGGWSDLMYVYPESHVYKVPKEASDQIAVLAEPMAVSYALDIAKGHSAMPNQGFCSADTVVVYGVGPLGICNLIKAKLLGAGLGPVLLGAIVCGVFATAYGALALLFRLPEASALAGTIRRRLGLA